MQRRLRSVGGRDQLRSQRAFDKFTFLVHHGRIELVFFDRELLECLKHLVRYSEIFRFDIVLVRDRLIDLIRLERLNPPVYDIQCEYEDWARKL